MGHSPYQLEGASAPPPTVGYSGGGGGYSYGGGAGSGDERHVCFFLIFCQVATWVGPHVLAEDGGSFCFV